MEIVKCQNEVCSKELTDKMQVEYSEEYGEYYCSLDCAIEVYVDKARNHILADHMHKHDDIEIKGGRIVYKTD